MVSDHSRFGLNATVRAMWLLRSSLVLLFFMADVAAQRREHVKTLRTIADEAGVAKCKDNAGRNIVKAMYEEMTGSDDLVDVGAMISK